ncbi:MAG TPA: uroporphyrinogen-III C-methyltransferase [Gemmatimonadaceae bacterium]
MTADARGLVYLVGAGPGDPGLITVRGHQLLRVCDAIATDALANPGIVDAARRANPRVEVHDVGKRGGDRASWSQDDINALLVRLGREGKRVVRLKGGDPFVFGRGSEEALALASAGVAFEVVPGVTAGIAAPAYAGIPVTHRGLATSVTFVTGHEDPTKEEPETSWASLARAGGTIVLYMGVKTLPAIARALLAAGMPVDTPAAAVQWGTHARQRTVVATVATLSDAIVHAGLSAPVITIIGDVVAQRDHIAWFERRPLFGRRVVVTRASAQAAGVRDALLELGAEVLEMPALRIEPLDEARARQVMTRLEQYDWVVFTSQNAVQIAWDVLRATGRDARAFAKPRIACIGRSTNDSLLTHGLSADVVPARFVAEGLLEALAARDDVRGRRVLYLAAEGARDVLPDGLRLLGCDVDVIPLYRSQPEETGREALRQAMTSGRVDGATFASASAVRGFIDAVGIELARSVPAISIGPITSNAIRDAGMTVAAEADEPSVASLVEATRAFLTATEHAATGQH